MSDSCVDQDLLVSDLSLPSLRPPAIGRESREPWPPEVAQPKSLMRREGMSRAADDPKQRVLDERLSLESRQPAYASGSCSPSPRASGSTPPALRWAENLQNLLDDSEGVALFKRFLQQEGGCNVLDFYFACLGVKRCIVQADKLPNLAKQIFKRFVRPEDGVRLTENTRRTLQSRITSRDVSGPEIFDGALTEAETILREQFYPLFLNSDLFLQYVQLGGVSSGAQSPVFTAEASRLAPLPDVPEHDELRTPVPNSTSSQKPQKIASLRLNPSALLATQKARAKGEQYASHLPGSSSRPVNPYHVHMSYAPASKQESEIASLSSDALTETDTCSSRDGSSRVGKAHSRVFKHMAHNNPEVSLHEHIIPRTERMPKEPSLAEVKPAEFAAQLAERLGRVLRERETSERVQHSLRAVSEGEELEGEVQSSRCRSARPDLTLFSLANVWTNGAPAEDADSILEEHMSLVWRESPKLHSPRPGRTRRHADWRSFGSVDSGVGEASHRLWQPAMSASLDGSDMVRATRHRHEPGKRPQDARPAKYRHDTERSAGARRKSSRRPADAVSNVDSGISGMSGAYSDGSRLPLPNLRDPKNERVMSWMNESDCIRSKGAHQDGSDKSSSNRRSHNHKSSKKSASSKDRTELSTPLPGPVTVDDEPPLSAAPGEKHKKKRGSCYSPNCTASSTARLVVVYYLCDESVPYRIFVNAATLTLAQFKSHVAKRGNYRYFFKRSSEDSTVSGCNELYDEITDDSKTVPLWDSKVFAKILPAISGLPVTSTGPGLYLYMLFDDEQTPFRCHVSAEKLTLAVFCKHLLKRGQYKCYFKTASVEFGPGVVFEEISDESQQLPLWQGHVVARCQNLD